MLFSSLNTVLGIMRLAVIGMAPPPWTRVVDQLLD